MKIWPVFNTIKVKKTNKKIQSNWNLSFIGLFYERDSTRLTSKCEFKHGQENKVKIKAHGSIMREEGSGRPEKLSEIH